MGPKDHRRGEMADTARRSGSPDGVLLRSGNRHAVSVDTALSLLTHRHRRILLQYLKRRPSQTVAFDTVVEEIVERERRRRSRPDDDTERSVAIHLRHQHLPKLERAGVLTYDQAADTVEYQGDPVLEVYLDVTEEIEE